ncbi:MAG: glycosyltransferase family 4 protein [Aggregatilineales bacterium]
MSQPVPILFTSWYSGLGGGETDLISIASHLDQTRYLPHLLLPREGQLGDVWREMGYPVHTTHWRGATTWYIPALWQRFPVVDRIEKIIRDEQIQHVHCYYHTLPFAYAAAKRAGISITWTVWGWWFQPKPWQRHFFQMPNKTLAGSGSVKKGFLGEPPFMNPDDVPIMHSGVDVQRFNPGIDGDAFRAELDIAPETPLVALVARFQEVKGHHTFQAMVKILAEQIPEAVFIVAGESIFGVASENEYRDRILQQAQNDPQLQGRLRYIGFRDDVERILKAADVVVCPSQFESYGRVNVEALACETPIVSSNEGGPSETIVHGEVGYLVPPGDAAMLAHYVLELLRDPQKRLQMGRAGRQHVIEHFSAEAVAARYMRVFEEVMPKNH